MNKELQIIKKALPRYLKQGNYRFYFHESLDKSINHESSFFETINKNTVRTLKKKPRRSVSEITLPGQNNYYVLKRYSFCDSKGKQLYRHKEYALDETARMIEAYDNGVPCPKVFAFGERRKYGLCKENFIIMESNNNAVHPLQEIKKDSASKAISNEEVLSRCKNLFLKLYEGRCNHVDMASGQTLLNTEDPSLDMFIDFQYAVTMDKKNLSVLMFQLSRFSWSLYPHIDKDTLKEWSDDVIRSAKNNISTLEMQNLEKLYFSAFKKGSPKTKVKMNMGNKSIY